MDRLLGGIIDDYTLYKIIEGAIAVLIMVAIYLGVQIILALKLIKGEEENATRQVPQRASFLRSTIFILIAGFFMLIHEFFEGLEKDAADYTTYELFELLAVMGAVLFLYEWHRTLKKLKKE